MDHLKDSDFSQRTSISYGHVRAQSLPNTPVDAKDQLLHPIRIHKRADSAIILTAKQSTIEGSSTIMDIDMAPSFRVAALDKSQLHTSLLEEAISTIDRILTVVEQNGTYGIVVNFARKNTHLVPTIVIGVPNLEHLRVTTFAAAENRYGRIPVVVIQDCFVSLVVSAPSNWKRTVVKARTRINIEEVSIGMQGSLKEAGSFGGYFSIDGENPKTLGLTCSHCLPEASIGDVVISPSAIELTSRFDVISGYTDLINDPVVHFKKQQEEAEALLREYEVIEDSAGVKLRDGRSIKLCGPTFGRVAGTNVGHKEILVLHNIMLQSAGKTNSFVLSNDRVRSRIDWAVFECDVTRVGSNTFEPAGAPIVGITLLEPGQIVEKVGRTTASTAEVVNGVCAQVWNDGIKTEEIAIIRDESDLGQANFADVGDSGSLIVTLSQEGYRAVGLVVGKNQKETSV